MDLNELKRNTWHGGQLLAFSGLDGETDFESGLAARTSFGSPGIDFKIPGSCRIRFPAGQVKNSIFTGDYFNIECGQSALRGVFLDAHHFIIEGTCEIIDSEPSISFEKEGIRTLIGSTNNFDPKKIKSDIDASTGERSKWLQKLQLKTPSSAASRRTLAKALSLLKTQVYTPEGRIIHRWTTPDRWPHRRMWLWDSVFHAIGWRHIDVTMARDAISAVLDMQQENGFVAHMMEPNKISEITQPPVLALGVKMVNDIAPSEEWIRTVYPKLCAYLEWDMANRDSDGAGLLEWYIEGDPNCRSGESGMDNSPRFDLATRMDAVDFNSFLSLECEIMSGFAASLGLHADSEKWKSHHARICRLINSRLWSEKYKLYVDYDLENKAQSPVLASSGFLPLICGAASKEQAALLAEHLSNPEMFGTALPLPSIAASDTGHYAKDMWRGPMWININWLVAAGFDRYGMHDVASKLREGTRMEIEKFCEKYSVFFEFFDDRQEVEPPQLLRKGKCAPEQNPLHQVFHDYGWTASLYVDLALSRIHSP
jgi:hypothetical protein